VIIIGFWEDWSLVVDHAGLALLNAAKQVDVGEWHAMDVKGKKELVSYELMNVICEAPVPKGSEEWNEELYDTVGHTFNDESGKNHYLWAEEQFQERVSREPLNPPPSSQRWHHETEKHLTVEEDGVKKFTHTYPERFWPRSAGSGEQFVCQEFRHGIRYEYGDLDDVVNLLARSPYTRQATFPIFFPEDTGAVHEGRIPCTLHYHFMLREGKLHMWYAIRSCDFVRHFRDDVYMAGRLLQWVIEELKDKAHDMNPDPSPWDDIQPGNLTMHIYSLHYFEGDRRRMEREYGS
jgi:hypothetical protein